MEKFLRLTGLNLPTDKMLADKCTKVLLEAKHDMFTTDWVKVNVPQYYWPRLIWYYSVYSSLDLRRVLNYE